RRRSGRRVVADQCGCLLRGARRQQVVLGQGDAVVALDQRGELQQDQRVQVEVGEDGVRGDLVVGALGHERGDLLGEVHNGFLPERGGCYTAGQTRAVEAQ